MLSNKLAMLLVGVLVATMLAACGGSSNNDPTATGSAGPTETAVAAVPTTTTAPTVAPTATAAATKAPTATARAQVTSEPRPIATSRPTATVVPTATVTTASVEDELAEWLLQPDDMGEGWETLHFGFFPVNPDGNTRCGMEPFAQRADRVTGVEATYETNATFYGHIYNTIEAYPSPEVAQAALEWQVAASNCEDYTDADGYRYTIYPGARGEWAEDSFQADMELFQPDGTPLYARYAYFRQGNILGTLAFVSDDVKQLDAHDWQIGFAAIGVIGASMVSLDGAGGQLGASRLVTPDDLAIVDEVNTWEVTNVIDTMASGRFEVCDTGSFPDVLGAESETGHFLVGNGGAGPYMAHSIVVMEPGKAVEAMQWIRDSFTACKSWVDNDDTYTVNEFGDVDVEDDSTWVLLDIASPDGSTGQLVYGFTRVGDMISVAALVGDGQLDLRLFGAMMALTGHVTAGKPIGQ